MTAPASAHPPLPSPHRRAATLLLIALAMALASCQSLTSQGGLGEGDLGQNPGALRDPFPWQGEQMSFDVQVAGVSAMTLDVSASQTRVAADGTDYIAISGSAETFGLFATFYPLKDSAQTFIHTRTWQPFFAVKDINEREKQRVYQVHYWHDEFVAEVTKEAEGEVHEHSLSIPSGTFDAVSFIYVLRQIPLEPGVQQTFVVYDGWKLNRIYLVVQEKENVWTPLGFYQAWRVDIHRELLTSHLPQGALAGLFTEPELTIKEDRYFAGNVWVTDDAPHIPVRMALDTRIGDIDMLISAYHPPSATPQVASP